MHPIYSRILWGQVPLFYCNMDKDNIKRSVIEIVENNDFFLVEIKFQSQGKLLLYIDSLSKDVTIEDCVMVSRKLLKEYEDLTETLSLEVSSPGIDHPFRVKEQYLKNIGREVEVLQKDGIKKTGKLLKLNLDSIILEETITKRENKKKITETLKNKIDFEYIKSTKLVIKV